MNARDDTLQHILQGNAKGVRRFCLPTNDADGDLLCVMMVAETATPIAYKETRLTETRTVSLDVKVLLEEG